MTDQPIITGADLGDALDRIFRAVHSTYQITTDGFPHSPSRETETLAAELGYTRQPGQWGVPGGDPLGQFTPNPAGAESCRQYRHEVGLRILQKAGATPADLDMVRDSLGIEVNDRLTGIADDLDRRNEQARQYWIDQAARAQGLTFANGEDKGRADAIREAFELTGDDRLLDMTWSGGRSIALELKTPHRER